MNNIKDFFNNFSYYGAFSFINQVGGVFLLPYYWSTFSLDDYSSIGRYQLVYYFLLPVLALGLNSSYERFYFEWAPKIRAEKLLSTFLAQQVISASAIFFLVLILNKIYSISDDLVLFAIAYSFFMSAQFLPLAHMRVSGSAISFGLFTNLSFLLVSASTVYSIQINEDKLVGFLKGQLIGSFAIYLCWCFYILTHASFSMNFGLRREFKFAWSIPPMTLLQKIGEFGDRLLAERLLLGNLFAVYTVSSQIGGYFNSVNSVLKLSFIPIVYRQLVGEAARPSSINLIALIYVYIISLAGLFGILFAEFALVYFGGDEYAGAVEYIKYFISVGVVSGLGVSFGFGLEVAKKVHLGFIALIPSVLISLLISVFLIPVLGVLGGVLGLLAGVFSRVVIRLVLSHKAMPRRFPFYEVLLLFSTYFLMVFVFSVVGRGEIQQLVLNLFLTIFVYGLIAVFAAKYFRELDRSV